MALCIVSLCLVCWIFRCESINQNQFSSLSDVKQALQKANIVLVNDQRDSSGVYHGEATIGDITFPLQFPWPLGTSGTIQLPSNQRLPVSDIRTFTGRLALQVGINVSLPPLQYVGLGNFGFSVRSFVISFNAGDPSSAELVFNIPGWDALNKLQFIVAQPKLNVVLGFVNHTFNVRAKGFMASSDPRSSANRLPIELAFPENLRDSLEISVADTNAVVEFSSLIFLLSSRIDTQTLQAIKAFSQNITVPKMSLRVPAGLSNISVIHVKTVSNRPFSVHGKIVMTNATFELTEDGSSFDAVIDVCGQQVSVTMLKKSGQYLILEARTNKSSTNIPISVEAFLTCVEAAKERRPDTNFIQMNVSSYKFYLRKFQINYKLRPKVSITEIGILLALPNQWNIFSQASLPTKVLNSTLSVQVILPRNSSFIEAKAEIVGQVVIGRPPLAEFPFVMKVPTRAEPLSLSLQDKTMFRMDFENVLKLGSLSRAFPSFMKPFSAGLLVTKLNLQFSPTLYGSFKIITFEMEIPSNTTWAFPYFYLGKMRIVHTSNQSHISGEIVVANFSLPCQMNWPTSKEDPVIELSESVAVKEASAFIKDVYRVFYGSKKLQNILRGLKKTKLSFMKGFWLEKALFYLSSNFSVTKVVLTGFLQNKYSWELLEDFFGVTDISVSMDIEVGQSFAVFIRGVIVLVDGSANIPFELNVPFSRNQSLAISLPVNEEPRISFQHLTGILSTAVRSKFPTALGSWLPELVLKKQKISFDEKLTEFEINELEAVRNTPWDLGGIGALNISNVTVFMDPNLFSLRGFLALGNIVLELELTKLPQGQMFRLVKPVKAHGLEPLVKDAFKKMIPGLKSTPDVSLLGLNILDASSVQLAEVKFTNNLDSLYSFAVTVSIAKTWSFFQSSFSLIDPTMNLRVQDLGDIPNFTLDVSGSLEFLANGNRLLLPLACNVPESHSSMITLKLQRAVVFNLSNIAALPVVGTLIPAGLLASISDFIGDVRLWPFEANFEPVTAHLNSSQLTVTALKKWELKGFPLALENITLKVSIKQTVEATLLGKIFLRAFPISVRIQFPLSLPDMLELKMNFQDVPDVTLKDIGKQLLSGFDLQHLFPPVFENLKISMRFLDLRLSPPLRQLQMNSFRARFVLKNTVTIIANWLSIGDIYADLTVTTTRKVSVAGSLACLVMLGNGANIMHTQGILTMPRYSSEPWELIIPEQGSQLSVSNIVALTGGGFDLKALFPDQILAKADKFVLKMFKAVFNSNAQFQIFNITCAFQANLSDVWLPLRVKIQHIDIKLVIESPFTAKQSVKVKIYVVISVGEAVVQTVLAVHKDFVLLNIESLKDQALTLSDLANLIGDVQVLKSVPVAFLNSHMTLNSLSLAFRKPQFDMFNVSVRCDLHGFDVGFSFPLPVPDPSNNFKASLAVQYLKFAFKHNREWKLTAAVKASFTGIPLEKHFKALEGLITVTPQMTILTLTKKLLDYRINLKFAGLDCRLNFAFSDPKIVFETPTKPQISISLVVTGFDILNKLFPFKVFKDKVEMYVFITEETSMAIKLKTIPIRDELLPCKEDGQEEYVCDFTWLCNKDSFVRLKLPSLAYTRDGLSAIIDVQGLEKLCVPLMLPIFRHFLKNIPFLYNLLKKNIPLWPPPDIIGSLHRIGCNTDNLPKGMERFKHPEFPNEITVRFSVSENGPLSLALEVQNGESVDVVMPIGVTGDLAAISFRRFSIGTVFGLPFVDIDSELYLWDLKFLILLSHLPRKNSLLINAEEMETRIICKDCFVVILGFIPIPIFAAPLSVKYATIIDLQAQVTIYHRRPDLKDLGTIASLLTGLIKYYTDIDYLLSMSNMQSANNTLLVLKLSHENDVTGLQLPKYTGGKKLKLSVPPIDGKKFLIAWMNFMKTFELKWLLQMVPLRYRVLNVAFNIGPFKWSLLKFAASSPNELRQNQNIWPYPVKDSGDDALIIASTDLLLLSADASFRMKNFGNFGLSLRLNAGITRLVKISFDAAAKINLEDSLNPMLISANAELKLVNVPLLTGEVNVTKDTITVLGELKLNFLGVIKLGGKVEAVYGPGLVFSLDAAVNLDFVGVRLANAHLYIKESPSKSVVRASCSFMGSDMNVEILRRGSSILVQAQANVVARLRVDLGKISVFGRDIGRIVLNTGFSCDLTISFPGRSSLEASFNFMGINIKLPTLAFESRDTRPSRILSLLVNHVTKKAPDLIKGLFQKNLRQLLKAIMDGLVKIVGNVGEFVKDILKTGLKLGAELVKDVGVFLNNLADSTKKIAEAAAKAAKAVAEAAKAAREAAKEAVKVAGKAVKQVSKVAEQAGRQLVEAGNALLQATQKVIRVGNTVREAKRVLKNISNTLSNVVNVIGQIAHKIADEIARGIRNIAGKVVKTFKRWFGKRSIHRRDILMDQKHEKERQKQALQRKQSNQQTRVRQKERELNDAKREEELKRTKRNDARNEALRSSDNLKKALKEKADKVAVYDDIIKTGKCARGEHNCHSKATCLRSGPDGLSFKCICKRGWVGNGVVCQRPIKGVVIMSDSPKAVGKVVSFSSFALSGTDVQYKYSFNSKFSEYGFASRAFNSPGVYVVNVLAKNSFSSDLASEIVVVQAPVSNVKLDIDGDRRACRAVHLTPSASGTNVSFTIDFGDNTSLENVTESVTHYFPHSGEFTINITAWNFVSSSNKTFVLRISSTPCDKLYCDIWAIETMFPDKTITKVASLAWSLQQASKAGTKEIRFNKLWKYLSLFNPVSQSILQKLSTENIFRNRTSQYSFSGSTIEIDFILAGILSSRMGYAGVIDGHDSSPFLPYIQRPLDTFTWITAALLPTSDFLNHWNTSTETTSLCQELLPTSIINSAIDGYILGALATNFSENTKLSNIVFEYYCPSNQSTQYNWKNRYLTLNNLSKILNNGKHLESVVTTSTFSNLAPNLEGFVSPIKGFCVRYLFESLWSEINTTNSRKISTQEEFCKLHTTCRECVSFGAKGKCFWCESYHACLPNNTWINCSHDQTFFKPPCPQTCHLNRQCRQCVSKPSCGWCESRGSGFCTEGKPRGPNSIAACSRADWYYETCALLCPMGQGRLCSGKGMCKAGRCYCLPGVYGKDCSKEGCVYKTKQNDTVNSMSSWSHVREIDIKMENIGRITVPTVAVNSIVTIPILEKKPKCVNATVDARFHRLFPRILRTTRNMVGLDSFCGLFGSIAAEIKSPSSCKGITSKEQCLKNSKCTWNIKEPCTGIIFNGCFKLSHWVDLVVKESEIIHSPISGNVKIKGDSVQITGWPNSEWESYIVDVSGLKPNHVTSIQSGEVIGTTLPKINPLLSTYIRIVVSRDNVFQDPKAYLLPCSSGCSQMVHFYNGICDQACNSKECNHDNGDCIPVYSNQTDFVLKPRSIHDLYSSRSLSVLYQLQKITGEKNVVITRGPISVFSLAKLVVLEVLNSSAIHSTLVYKTYRHPIIKYVSYLRAQNMTVEKITLLTAERLIELGVYNVSLHGRSGSDYDIAEIETSSLENENNFQVGLNMLVDAQLLRFTLVRNDSQAGTPYFQLVIPRDIIDVNWFHHFDASLIHNSPCDSLTSCSGHGVCFNNGSCKCDAFYMGRKCQFNNCPGRCSGHGTCLEGVCVCSFGWEGEDCSEVKLCTPLCPEAWIGDGVCDPDCDTPKCLKDKGDCQDVCICPEAWLSDGSCDQMCNTSVCKLDGGDCVEEECSPGCRLQMLGDGICDHQCNTEMCQLDKGDCDVISTCTCSLRLQGNGLCDEDCNNAGCMYDYGDCAVRVTGENCPHACSPPMIANGFCDLSCNVLACNFDGGDCNPDSDTKVDFCSEGCIASFRGDGVCDSVCNVEACGFDNGDCPKSIAQECSPECRLDMVGDGTCQSQCLVEECSFDANDCQCAPGCLNSSLGNGVCNVECFVGPCDYDNLDCMCSPKKCPKHFVGNGNCDVECNNRICDFDGGDCECAPGCSLTSIADGSCDPACDTKLCHFDGLDCGGCEADSHSHICDENAYCVVTNKSVPFVQCQCKRGFYGDGFSCLKRGNCFNGSDICSRNGRCVPSNGTFECYCNRGWKGNGIFCENVDECKDQSHSCSINARCVDLPGGYKCVCETGWTGDGFNCTDINECKIDRHSCCENERCVNKEGNYSCECKDGWRENSSSPTTSERCTTGINPTCVDVDECAEEIHNCSTFNGQANAVCTNTIGGFLCTCEHGWQGDGFYCSDINECVNSSVCGINQLCRNLAGNYSCSCKDGWTFSDSSNNECQDVDECLLGLDDCDVFARCVNTDGSFTCECMKGFEDKGRICTRYHCINQTNNGTHLNDGNITATNNELCTCSGEYLSTGRTCADIDECMLDNFNCPSSAPICQNLMGGYECTCNAVDNSSCDAVSPCDSSNNTCNENMTCIEVGIEHYCVCPEGYTEDQNGTACIDINECINLQFYGSCDVNAECINVEGSFECKCRPGFFQSGDTCFEIDECEGTISNTVEGRLQECHAGACASTQTCAVYNVSNDDSKASNTSLICACEEDDNRKLDCVEAKLTIVQSGVNVSTLISIPWNLTLNTTSSATVTNNYTLLAHNCSTRAVCSNTAGSYKCVCLEGFQSNDGGWTCFDTDECLANDTCHPNATCSNTEGSFNCTCKSGFIGNGINNCSDIDECSFVNCSQNSVCVNTVGDYFCSCQDGFRKNTNLLCEDIDECFNSSLNRCHPRASCHNYIGGYNCSCKIGYSGDGLSCSDINECMDSSILCGEHASCYNTLGSYKCTCNPGWTGDGQTCSNIDECALGLHTCVENSYCSDNQGSYTCSCHRGWMRQWFEPYGRCSRCDSTTFCSGHGQCLRNGTCDCLSYYSGANCSVCIPDVRCSGHGVCDFNGTCYCDHGWTRQPLDCGVCFPEELCSGHGICNYDLMTYKNKSCFCDDNYYSHNCSKACPIIKGEICGPHGSCTQDHGGLRPCICHLGYQWNENSSSCEDTDECVAGSHDCLSPARCINTPGSYRCECPSLVGWSFDGKSCSDTDECQFPDVCHPHASCTNYPGGFKCSCNTGWRGQGEHPVCSDIDECGEGIDRCPNPSRCINTVGSYYCECNSGWQKVSQFQCVDIDECSRGIHGCDRNSYCVNTAGSWKCVCNNGWYPDPSNARLPTCRDVNECVNKPNACPQQSTCTNSPGSYRCNCLSGWRNQGPHSCSDVNECSEGSHRCPYNSQCINTAGSYVCNCLSGWRNRDHYSCVDVNECSEGRFSCPANSHCVNTQGSYRCDCNRCFYKSGSTCNNDCRLQTQYYYTTTYTTYTTYYSTSCGWHGLSRCRESRRKRKTKSRRTSRQVWVGNRPGARCPCT